MVSIYLTGIDFYSWWVQAIWVVPNTDPVHILFIVWVCWNEVEEDIKNVSCTDTVIDEENLTNNMNSNNPYHKEHYKRYCKTLTKVIITAKHLYYDELISKCNNKQKTSWNIIKTINNNNNNNINNGLSWNINGTLTTDPLLTANAFNTYFMSIAENLLTKNFSRCDVTNSNSPMTHLQQNFHPFSSLLRLNNTTTYEIGKIIHSLKSKDSHGYDEISSKILKVSAPYILSPLTYIFNKML